LKNRLLSFFVHGGTCFANILQIHLTKKTNYEKDTVRIFLIAMLVAFMANPAKAQGLSIDSPNYRTAIGLRGGELGGLTFKHFTQPDGALEVILGLGYRHPRIFSLTVLYEKHVPAFNVSGMRWYYGGGGHVALVGNRSGYYDFPWGRRYYYETGAVGLGIDGIFGLEYKIPPIPFAISLDFKPYIEVFSQGGVFWSLDPALGIKLTF
jgi:hypothetical protein